jgi:hypothetical protein
VASCPCGHSWELFARPILAMLGNDVLLGKVRDCLRCHKCQKRRPGHYGAAHAEVTAARALQDVRGSRDSRSAQDAGGDLARKTTCLFPYEFDDLFGEGRLYVRLDRGDSGP